MKLEYATKKPKTKLGEFLCWLGLHRWHYHCYRTCKRCGRTQTLYGYGGYNRWED